jgi:hypothetical protein
MFDDERDDPRDDRGERDLEDCRDHRRKPTDVAPRIDGTTGITERSTQESDLTGDR